MRAHLLSLMVSTAAILLLWAIPPRRRRSRRRRGRGRRKSAARLWLVAMGVLLGITVVGGVLVSSDVKPFSTYAERYLLSGRSQAPAPTPLPLTAHQTVANIPTPASTATPIPAAPTPNPDPPQRHIESKRTMLDLINDKREFAGVPSLVLGDNPAAQLHAESSLENCYLSHWGMDGLKPYMRYSAAGGYQSNGENGHGIGYCPNPDGKYRSKGLEADVKGAVEGWMNSHGHRRNMLYPHHRKANIGMAWDGLNIHVYLHLEGDHIRYDTLPQVGSDGIFRLSGSTRNGASFRNENDLGVYIYYDPPPHDLTLGQLARTYCYGVGRTVAALRQPLLDGSRWSQDQYSDSFSDCPNPYDVDPNASVPTSYEEALLIGGEAHRASKSPDSKTVIVPWITATEWHVTANSFKVTADLSDVLKGNGRGVYTVKVWARIADEGTDISTYSIFRGVEPPDVYQLNTN